MEEIIAWNLINESPSKSKIWKRARCRPVINTPDFHEHTKENAFHAQLQYLIILFTVLPQSFSMSYTISYLFKAIIFLKMKVVIPSTHCRHKKMVFSTPRDEFWIFWRDIWEEGTWDRYWQAPKLPLVVSHTYGQHDVLTKVA